MVTRPGRLDGKVAIVPRWGDLIPHVKVHERRPPGQAGS